MEKIILLIVGGYPTNTSERAHALLIIKCPANMHNLDNPLMRTVRDLALNDDVTLRTPGVMESRDEHSNFGAV